ncbi:MAG: restriction endonuclease subunit S [Sandaracinus sp.]|nr:restriction endonuclease subunit S [Sandaracinus sp.]MCB9616939.1 restriction endonuclease subunit S [Sandaracinus sp.]MCB9633977.1 restriction endonuclease subunit S [Sandaracinus sp.]
MSDSAWVETQLKRLCSRGPEYGANIPSDQYENTGLRFLRTTDISDAGLLRAEDAAVYVSRAQAASAGALLQSGDLLLSRSGSIGRSFLYDERLHGPCSFAGYLVRFRPTADVEPRFLFHWTKSLGFEQQLNADAIQTTIQNFNGQKYGSMSLRIPRAKEHQRAIADFLDRKTAALDALIDKKERLLALLQEKRQALITQAVTKGLDPNVPTKDSGIEWLGEIPAHWEIKAIWTLFRPVKEQGFPGLPLLSVYRDYGVILKDTRDDNHNRAGKDLGVYQRVLPGDLVINKMKAWQGSLGISSHLGIVSPDYQVLRPREPASDFEYLHHLLRTPVYFTQYRRLSYGIRPDQWRLMYESFRTIPVLIPPQAEQHDLVCVARREDSSESAQQALHAQLDRLREYRQALITAAVTGQLDVSAQNA